MSAQPAQFTLPFTHYSSLGYSPCPTTGKVPAYGMGWYERQYSPDEYATLDKGSCNVGLRCSNIVGLDIDVADSVLAAKVEAVCRKVLGLPKSTPVRVGSAPKRLLVARVAAPISGFDIKANVDGKQVTLFQVLGAGKQFVIHGTHPDTRKPYTLSSPLPKHARLKLVDVHDLINLKGALLELFEAEGFAVRSTGKQGAAATGKFSEAHPWTEVGMQQAEEALHNLDPDMCMDEWVQVGFAIYDGTHGSDDGLYLWTHWSAGGDKFKDGDCDRRWRGFKPGGGVTKATLFKNSFPKLEAAVPVAHEPPTRLVEGEDGLGISAAALFDHDAGDVPWIVQDTMTYGAHLLVGRPKGGKSWVTMDMAYACGAGGAFLGKQARKTGVLWIASEDTNDGLSRRLKVRGERPLGDITVLTGEGLRAERRKWEDDVTFAAWLEEYLKAHEHVGLVILDTIESVYAKWNDEKIDEKRHASVTQVAYQKSRVYEDIGQSTKTCIVLVTHTRKRNGKEITDYHELINEAQTIVAGATASLVLADPADRDPHAKDDFRRVFAMRGRSIIHEQPLMIELQHGRATSLGTYYEVKQTEAQSAVFSAIEAILNEQETTTISEVAKELGMSQRNVADLLGRCKRDGSLTWKGRKLVIKAGRNGGLRWM
jgi:hypothetical protein